MMNDENSNSVYRNTAFSIEPGLQLMIPFIINSSAIVFSTSRLLILCLKCLKRLLLFDQQPKTQKLSVYCNVRPNSKCSQQRTRKHQMFESLA